jgi:hypothetical protein
MQKLEKYLIKGAGNSAMINAVGTREDFLDYVIKWVENPKSERVLVLLDQAGTGKSSIAHEIARPFENKCLGSYFPFLRKEHSKDETYYLFTTLARDLSDHCPPFRLALGRVIKDDSSLRSSRDYRTLFERIILEPLKDLQVGGPILLSSCIGREWSHNRQKWASHISCSTSHRSPTKLPGTHHVEAGEWY